MRVSMHAARAIGMVACLILLTAPGAGQAPPAGAPAVIPKNATALEGQPTIRIDATKEGATRRQLDVAEAAKHNLKVRIVDGKYYWSSRDGRPLKVWEAGAFTYLASTEPGHYIRLRKVDDKLEYVEHVDKDFVSVTFWGELRVILKK